MSFNVNLNILLICSGARQHQVSGGGRELKSGRDQGQRHPRVSPEVHTVHREQPPEQPGRDQDSAPVWRQTRTRELPFHRPSPLRRGLAGLRSALQGLPEGLHRSQSSPADTMRAARRLRQKLSSSATQNWKLCWAPGQTQPCSTFGKKPRRATVGSAFPKAWGVKWTFQTPFQCNTRSLVEKSPVVFVTLRGDTAETKLKQWCHKDGQSKMM